MDPSIGGPCQGIRNSIPELLKLGVYNEVTCLDSPDAKYLGQDSFVINAIGPGKGPWKYCSALIPWILNNYNRFDKIIIHGLWQYHSYAVNRAIKTLKKQLPNEKIPMVYVMPHGMLDPWFQRASGRKLKAIRNWIFWKLIEGDVINEADGILFTCQEELKLAREPFQPYSPKQELNVSYGIHSPPYYSKTMDTAFKEKCPGIDNSPYILFLSRIDIKKGVDLLIKSYIKLKSEGMALPKLVIAGPGMDTGYGKKLLQLASGEPDIIFPGMLSGDFKWGAFYGCEAFILPSHQENFGIAVVEALACGKPVLISNQVNIWNEIFNGNAGLIASDTLEGTSELLTNWIKLPDDTKVDMGNSAKTVYIQHFSIIEAAKKLANTLNPGYTISNFENKYEIPRPK